MSQRHDFLAIGHVTKDVIPGGYTIGGTVTYAAIAARNLGYRVAVLTSAEPTLDLGEALAGVDVHRVPATATTTFENLYANDRRQQYLYAVAASITTVHVPADWQRIPVVHLGPLARELAVDLPAYFSHSLVGVTPQGWLRSWNDEDRQVKRRAWVEAPDVLAHTDVLILSEEDVEDGQDVIAAWARMVPIVVVTQGPRGVDVYVQGERRHVSAFPAREVDPTGAGDVFAASFLLRLWESDDPHEAARFANCVASFCVEGPGTTNLPTRERVARRLRQFQENNRPS
jgi:sugar/nucleoside kinase (ribokinase family)